MAGGTRRRTGRDAVVDDDHHPSGERLRRTARSEAMRSPFQLVAFATLHLGKLLRRDPGTLDEVGVDVAGPVLADGAHCELRLERNTELAHDDDIERRLERSGNLVCYRHAATRQADHDDVRVRPIVRQAHSELSTGISTVREHTTPPARPRTPMTIRR